MRHTTIHKILIVIVITFFVGAGCSDTQTPTTIKPSVPDVPLHTQGEVMQLSDREYAIPIELRSCTTDADCTFVSYENLCYLPIVANKSKKDEIKDTYHWFLEYEGKFNQVNIDEENRMEHSKLLF